MRKIKLLLSQAVEFEQERGELRDWTDQRLVRFLDTLGFFVIPVPNCLCDRDLESGDVGHRLVSWINDLQVGGIVLGGGNDIGQMPCRDLTESILLDQALIQQLPVLGICRGMQLISTKFGSQLTHAVGHVAVQHQVSGEINRNVNSYHSRQILNCPEGFRVLARSEDGCIEAIRNDDLGWEGWMWHPERTNKWDYEDCRRTKQLFTPKH